MPHSVIGAQLYTLRDFLKTPQDIAHTCARVKKMGYDAVQVSALGPIEVVELAKILDGEGLVCAATHKPMDDMKDTAAILDYHAALKCRYTAIGGFGWGGKPLAEWQAFARDYSLIARTLSAKGLAVGYHNHAHELARVADSAMTVPLDLLVKTLDPSAWFEIDTYWIAFGGGDPAAWIDRVAASAAGNGGGRIPCVHFKDMRISPDMKDHKMCEVGDGNLNWPRILEACKAAGVEWYLVERDSGDLDPFDSLKISLENLRAMGLQ
jgi:sugar phosphate isomerase/epimerase